jgi:hypothetical protein
MYPIRALSGKNVNVDPNESDASRVAHDILLAL